MTLKEMEHLSDGEAPDSDQERLRECYMILHQIAYGSGRPGDRPLAGGIEVFAKKVLKRHGLERFEDIIRLRCPCCGHEPEEHHEVPEVQGLQGEHL